MRPRVYVAGPISNGDLSRNIRSATEAGIELMRAGYAPLVPHLTCYMGGDTPEALPLGTSAGDWYETDLPWVAVSDAVLRLPGDSIGANKEVLLALSLGIPVFYSMDELLDGFPIMEGGCNAEGES